MNNAELFQRYFAKEMQPPELAEFRRRLEDDHEFGREFVEFFAETSAMTRVMAESAELARATAGARPAAPGRPEWRPSWRQGLGLALAATLLAAVGVWWMAGSGKRETAGGDVVARAEKVSGVRCQVSGGAWTELAAGDEVRAGTKIETGKGGAVRLAWVGEATSVELGECSVFSVQGSGKSQRLDRGRLTATVAKQAPGRPFVVETPHARATVVGTRFRLLVSESSGTNGPMHSALGNRHSAIGFSRLDVDEGVVRLARLAQGDSLDVAGGEAGMVGEGLEFKKYPAGTEPAPAAGELNVSPGSLTVEGALGSKITRTVTFTNSGTRALTWRIRSNQVAGKTRWAEIGNGTIPFDPSAHACEGGDIMWAFARGGLVRVDARSGTTLSTIPYLEEMKRNGIRGNVGWHLAWDGDREVIWTSVPVKEEVPNDSSKFQGFEARTGRIRRLPNPGNCAGGGISYGDGTLWLMDPIVLRPGSSRSTRIYKVSPDNGAVLKVLTVTVPSNLDGFDLRSSTVEGLAHMGNMLWLPVATPGPSPVAPRYLLLRVSAADGAVLGCFEDAGSGRCASSDGKSGLWRELAAPPPSSSRTRRHVETAEADWLIETPESGTVPPGSSVDMTVTLDTAKVGVGTHNLTIQLRCDDQAVPEIGVPVRLTVSR